jgi:type I restriction enzyme S subunit
MVPKGWEVKELQFLCKKIAVGLAISVTPFMRASGVKLIRNQNIKRNYFNNDSVVYIDEAFANSNNSKKVRHGDVVAVRTGSNIGEACVVPKDFDGALTFTTLIARPNSALLDSFYLSTHINSDLGISEVNRLCAGGGKPNLNSGELKRYRLLTPPLDEQKKIAEILSTWDKAITTTEQLLANSQQQKKALIQQLLTGKKRLLDRNGVRFSGEWKTYHLSHVTAGSSPKSEAYNENGIGLPLLQGNADIKNRISAPRVFTSEITKECEIGDILLSVRAPVGTVAISEHKACIGRGIAALHAKPNFDQNFIYQLLLWYEPKWGSLSQGSTFESINSDDIKNLKIKVPNFNEQQKIAFVLSTADQEISALQQKFNALNQEKKALMQQLLTGKRRVQLSNREVA